MTRLGRRFFARSVHEVAPDLIGDAVWSGTLCHAICGERSQLKSALQT